MFEQRFEPVRFCIYCGEQKGPFSDEHIVPFSLGGNILLPQACCTECQERINVFETHIATETYLSFRSAQRLPSRTKSLVTTVDVEFEVGPFKIVRQVPIDDAPIQTIIPSFGLPPYVAGVSPPTQLHVLPIDENCWKRTFQHYKEAKRASYTSGGIRIEYFVRLIMKIAYGLAWVVDAQCAFQWVGRKTILYGNFPHFPEFDDIFSVASSGDGNEIFRGTVFTDVSEGRTNLFCQIEILVGSKVPAYVCHLGVTRVKHPFGLEFTASRDILDLGGMQLRLPPDSHLR